MQDKGAEVEYLAVANEELLDNADITAFCDDYSCELWFIVEDNQVRVPPEFATEANQEVLNALWPRIVPFDQCATKYCLIFSVNDLTCAMKVLRGIYKIVGGEPHFIDQLSLYPNAAGQLDLVCAKITQ